MLYRVAKHHEREIGLPIVLNEMGLTGIAVEIGTHKAVYAQQLLMRWNGIKLFCVDPYVAYDDKDPSSHGNREEHYEIAKWRTRRFGERVSFIRKTSVEAVKEFEDGRLDFIYVDGNHRHDHVLQDLTVWWPKLRSGGVIAGHDYICPTELNDGWGLEVQPAVHTFCQQHKLEHLYLIPELGGMPWGYYLIKP